MRGRPATHSLDEEGRALVERLGGRWTAGGGLCLCPAHDDRSPSLSVRVGSASLLLHCFAGCTVSEVLRALRATGQPLGRSPRRARETAPGPRSDAASAPLDRAALRLWSGARPIAGTPAERYLKRRALCGDSAELRYHHRTPHGPSPLTRFRPALIAAVRDDSGVVAVHRTFLDPRRDALAPIADPRCGLGRFGRGAVRLGGIAPRIGLAEGIETALSASVLFGLPCWATLGTERFRLVALPPEVKELALFPDNDAGGRRAEALAREAHADLPIEVHYPRRRGGDWNDVLRAMTRHPAS